MAKELENKKMWESILGRLNNCEDAAYKAFIIDSLEDQGLKWNGKEIVSIEPEQFRPELGKWYYCFRSWHNKEMYHNGGIYKAVTNTHFDDVALLSDDGNSYPWDCKEQFEQYFRPATVEEVLNAKHGITGIKTKKSEGKLGEMISQRMESAEAKEALYGKPEQELTEFEDAFIHIYEQKYPCELNDKDLDFCRKAAKELLSIARKEIVSEVDPEQLTENFKQYVLLKEANGCDGTLISLGTDCYKRGIKHCLDEIELKGIVREE